MTEDEQKQWEVDHSWLEHHKQIRPKPPYDKQAITAMLLEEQDYGCYYCGVEMVPRELPSNPREWTLDHVIPLSADGPDKPSNLVVACFECNGRKADKSLDEFLDG